GRDNVVRRWDVTTSRELGRFQAPAGTGAVAFSPDGRLVALANADATIRLHDTATGKELRQLKGHTNGTAALAFSADGKRLASRGSGDNLLRLHDVASGSELRQIALDPGNAAMPGGVAVNVAFVGGSALAFAPDGQTVAAHVQSGVARVMI